MSISSNARSPSARSSTPRAILSSSFIVIRPRSSIRPRMVTVVMCSPMICHKTVGVIKPTVVERDGISGTHWKHGVVTVRRYYAKKGVQPRFRGWCWIRWCWTTRRTGCSRRPGHPRPTRTGPSRLLPDVWNLLLNRIELADVTSRGMDPTHVHSTSTHGGIVITPETNRTSPGGWKQP